MHRINTVSRHAIDDLLGVIATSSRHAEQALQQAGLLSSVFDARVSELPLPALWRLTERISRLEHNPHFCFEAGMTDTDRAMNAPVAGCDETALDNLFRLRQFIDSLNEAAPGTLFWLEIDEHKLWLLYQPVVPSRHEGWNVEQYVIARWLKFLQTLLGAFSHPIGMQLRCSQPDGGLPAIMNKSRVAFSQATTGLAIPLEMILREQADQHREPSILTLRQGDGFERKSTAMNTARIQALINYQVLGGKPGIRGLANALSMSVRTLQRRLAEHNINYADTVMQCRLELAKEQLASSELRISEIAYGLGYKHANDFSRAFYRNTNCSPVEYRRAQ